METRLLPALFLSLLAAQETPRTLLTADDFARMSALTGERKWAAAVRDSIAAVAGGWPQAYFAKYGLTDVDLPPDGGQWAAHYICPRHSVALRYTPPMTHTCPIDGQTYGGWPYDQVIYAREHDDLATYARDLALAWRLTGREDYARQAAYILNLYAARYGSYAIHGVDGRATTSGARVLSQTLDESVWLVSIAWAYDLLAGSGVFLPAERAAIEDGLLRAAAAVIRRNDAGMSNWQSWHNAAIGAAGYATGDTALIEAAIDGKSGFRYQMRNSVLGEGLWYEGSWGYHFYALHPLLLLAEMAARNGTDLYAEPNLRKMFELPVRFALPDGTLAAFNDTGQTSLYSQDAYYEIGYARYGDPQFLSVLGRRARPRYGLFFGAAELPAADALRLQSDVLPDSGYALLRAASSDHALIFKFGPHGGWHGHYDKLSFVSFGRGAVLGVDPGSHSYASPLHDEWDRVSLAHNTVTVDEKSQVAAAGRLLWTSFGAGYSAARAEAGPAAKGARLERTIVLTDEYALDSFVAQATDGAEHQFDWVYHNAGARQTELPLAAYTAFPKSAGYQHLSNNRAAAADGAWQMTFDIAAGKLGAAGTVWPSTANVSGTLEYTREQVQQGAFAAKATYRFNGAGYLLATANVTAAQPAAVPAGLSLWVHGDGSGHKLTLRLYDATDERFTIGVGAIDWNGWRKIEVRDPAAWNHYLGNADGVIDLPVKSACLELQQTAGAPAAGALYVDDIRLQYENGGDLTANDFELTLANVRVWMLGAAGTTVVAGEGIGPDLTKPVSYVMARRRGLEARFVALLEPHGTAPAISEFRQVDANTFVVGAAEWEDTISCDEGGVRGYERRRK